MTQYFPQVGEWVRVVLEGPVVWSLGRDSFRVGNGQTAVAGASNMIYVGAKHVKSVEKIDPPEPPPPAWWPLRKGDVVRCNTAVYLHTRDGLVDQYQDAVAPKDWPLRWWLSGHSGAYRELELLVRDGRLYDGPDRLMVKP